MRQTPDISAVERHFDQLAPDYDRWKKKNWFYYRQLKRFVGALIAPGNNVLELGCGTGELLASVAPSRGVGIDVSPQMISRCREKYPRYEFFCSAIETCPLAETFDYIIVIDVLDHVYDIVRVLEKIRQWCHRRTRVIITTINPWWEPLLHLMERLGAKMPEGPHNFVERRNLARMVELSDFSADFSGYLLLAPKYVPLLSGLANTVGVRLPLINKLSFVHYTVLSALPPREPVSLQGCSVVIPCLNEADNIGETVRRIPEMGNGTEIIVVSDGSTDDTAAVVRGLQAEFPRLQLIEYTPNRGKGYAVGRGVAAATQEFVIILDADLSVAPEELPVFFRMLSEARADFVNASRLVYPMEDQAMRYLNLFGNKLFGFLMSFLLGQPLTDTLCGTKAFRKADYLRMAHGYDRWGDFDLLFGAAGLGCKIVEVPVHYLRRRGGESKMQPLAHGVHLLKACFRGMRVLFH